MSAPTWQDDQRVLCDALLERGYRVEMWLGRASWTETNHPTMRRMVWPGPIPGGFSLVSGAHVTLPGQVYACVGLGEIGRASTIPEAVALVVEHLDLDGRPL